MAAMAPGPAAGPKKPKADLMFIVSADTVRHVVEPMSAPGFCTKHS